MGKVGKDFDANESQVLYELNGLRLVIESWKTSTEKRSGDWTEEKEGPDKLGTVGVLDLISPFDFRYYGREFELVRDVGKYLSERAFIKYQTRCEVALSQVLAERGVCTPEQAAAIQEACKKVRAEDVYKEEDRIRHDVRALVNTIRKNIPLEQSDAKKYVHLANTSFDKRDSAEALRFIEYTGEMLVPELKKFQDTMIKLAEKYAKTPQIGRTHGQHAEPITFGFALAQYVDRIGNVRKQIEQAADSLIGKISGATGAYNASMLIFDDPEKFEADVLGKLGLKPGRISTQIVQPEPMANYCHLLIEAVGVMADFSNSMRQLQRPEIAEVGEPFKVENQVGSSTMPHKRNPITFENIVSMYKVMMPRMLTIYADAISEHQRDLTNSASSRFRAELAFIPFYTARTLNRILPKLEADPERMLDNLKMNGDLIMAEPLYILLSSYGHLDAHETSRKLTDRALGERKKLADMTRKHEQDTYSDVQETVPGPDGGPVPNPDYVTHKMIQEQSKRASLIYQLHQDPKLEEYWQKFTPEQRELLLDPIKYTGIAAEKALKVCDYWRQDLGCKKEAAAQNL